MPSRATEPRAVLRGAITLTLSSRLGDVAMAGTAVRAICRAAGLDEDGAGGMELAVVEVLNNVIIHGHAGADGFTIQVALDADDARVEVRITDAGAPVPAAAFAPRPALERADRDALPESGMGLMLVRQSVDWLEYRAGPDGNTTTLSTSLKGGRECRI